jgi:hypothetical protein
MRYSIEIRDQFGRLVTVIQRPQQKQFSIYRNKPGSLQFTVDLLDPQATAVNFAVNQYDVVVRRLGTPLVAGQISYLEPTIDGDQKQLNVIATGYFDLLDYRYVDETFPGYDTAHDNLPFGTPTDAGQVAWTLIQGSQFPISSDGSQTLSGPGLWLAQSFISQGDANVATIKLLLQNQSATGNLLVGIYPDVGGVPGGSPIVNSLVTIPTGSVSASLSWYEIDYPGTAVPPLQNGVRYWVQAHLDTAQSGGNGVAWSYLANNFYPSGKAYCPQNPSLFLAGQSLQFFVLCDDGSYQQTKNTYLGIRQGTIAPSFPITPTYDRFKKLKSAIEDIANMYNAMDFDITIVIDPVTNRLSRYFNVFYPRQGVVNTGLVFTYPGTIKKVDKSKDGKQMVNQVAERGQGSGVDQAVMVSYDQASIQAYGMRQDQEDEPDVPDTGTLQLLGLEVIRLRKDTLELPALTMDDSLPPFLGSYGIGDQILVQITNAGIASGTFAYRIEQIDGTVDSDDVGEIVLTLSLA